MSVRQFLYGFVLTTFLASSAWAAKAIGTFMVVKGKVTVVKANGKKKRAKVGMKIHAKDQIESKKNARAKIVMLDKNVVNISPETKMSFDKYVFEPKGDKKDVLINVLYGKVRNNVKQKYDENKGQTFRVKTKAAVAGVRGTDFLSGYSLKTKQAQFVTFEGVVEVGNFGAGGKLANTVRVTPGQITTVAAGAPPIAPRKVSNRALASFDQNSGGTDNRNDAPAGDQGNGPRGPEAGPENPENTEGNKGPGGPEARGPDSAGPGPEGFEPGAGPDVAGPGPEGPGGEGMAPGGFEDFGPMYDGHDTTNTEHERDVPPDFRGPAYAGGPNGADPFGPDDFFDPCAGGICGPGPLPDFHDPSHLPPCFPDCIQDVQKTNLIININN